MLGKFKHLLPLGLFLFLFAASSLTIEHSNEVVNEFTYKRGTNISHWLSQSNRRAEERLKFFTEKDVQYLAGIGFDHLRIPVDEEQLWKENGEKDAEAF